QVRTLILRDYDRAFERVDVVAMPTSPTAAFPIGERASDPLQMYLADIFTVSANLAGLPAISVPCGFTRGPGADVPASDGRPATPKRGDAPASERGPATPKRGDRPASDGGPATPKLGDASASEGRLPIGLQLTGRRFDESTLL